MILDYCSRKNLGYEFELFELEDMAHLPTLNHIVRNLKCNPVLYSIFALPEEDELRVDLLRAALSNGLTMHFVNEDLVLATDRDLAILNRYLEFAKYGHSRMPIGLPLSDHSQKMLARWIRADDHS